MNQVHVLPTTLPHSFLRCSSLHSTPRVGVSLLGYPLIFVFPANVLQFDPQRALCCNHSLQEEAAALCFKAKLPFLMPSTLPLPMDAQSPSTLSTTSRVVQTSAMLHTA